MRDFVLAVAAKKTKIVISEMFTAELKFAADCLLEWFNQNFKSNNLELSSNYEIEHKRNMKLSIRLIGFKIVVVFLPFLSKLTLRRTCRRENNVLR